MNLRGVLSRCRKLTRLPTVVYGFTSGIVMMLILVGMVLSVLLGRKNAGLFLMCIISLMPLMCGTLWRTIVRRFLIVVMWIVLRLILVLVVSLCICDGRLRVRSIRGLMRMLVLGPVLNRVLTRVGLTRLGRRRAMNMVLRLARLR